MTKKVLVTDDVHAILLEGLKERSYQVAYHPEMSLEEVREIVHEYEGLVINSKIKADAAFIDQARALQFIARLGSGLEIIDLEKTREKGIAVISAPEGNCNAVAEHAMGMILALMNNLIRSDQEVKAQVWERERNRGEELAGKTVGIIGYGHTGKAFAQKLSGFDVKVRAYDPFIERPNLPSHVIWSSLEDLQRESDIVSLHVSLNDSSHHLINQTFIENCGNKFYLINTSRGKAVKLMDLLTALEAGKVRGACLDVFENEKPSTFSQKEIDIYSRLYQMDQVILSPHVAGWSVESKRKIAEVILQKIDLFMSL